MNTAQRRSVLTALGFRADSATRYTQAVRDFQGGWGLGAALVIDGQPGPATDIALATSEAARRAGRGTLTQHFSFADFRCHCGGRFASCRRVAGEGARGHGGHVLRDLAGSLERLRGAHYQHGLTVISGYRCDSYNASIGGATSSQHRFGAACDVAPLVSTRTVAAMHEFAGIGFNQSSGNVAHVDRRDRSGVNPTGGSPSNPTTWRYGR